MERETPPVEVEKSMVEIADTAQVSMLTPAGCSGVAGAEEWIAIAAIGN